MWNEWILLPLITIAVLATLNILFRAYTRRAPLSRAPSDNEPMIQPATVSEPKRQEPDHATNSYRLIGAAVASLVVGLVALGIVGFADAAHPGRPWATATLGTVLGFWLNEKTH
jgi:hypothetical protein